MENPRILKRRWTLTRKAQVVFAAFVFLLTSALAVFQAMQVTLPNKGLGQSFAVLYYVAMIPTSIFADIFGISQKLGPQAFQIIAILLNTVLVFCFVGLLGKLITMVKPSKRRTEYGKS